MEARILVESLGTKSCR